VLNQAVTFTEFVNFGDNDTTTALLSVEGIYDASEDKDMREEIGNI
jgi:hypothetical protein